MVLGILQVTQYIIILLRGHLYYHRMDDVHNDVFDDLLMSQNKMAVLV